METSGLSGPNNASLSTTSSSPTSTSVSPSLSGSEVSPVSPISSGESATTSVINASQHEVLGQSLNDATSVGIERVADHVLDTIDASALTAIDRLNSDGDTVYLRTTLEGKAGIGGGVPGLAEGKVGLKGQYGGDLSVTQIGDGPDAQYRVTVEKHALGALTGNLEGFEQEIKAELGIQTFDRVELTFDTKEEALRAGRIVQRLAVADAISDAAGSASPAGGSLSPGGGDNPLANPLNGSGAPGDLSLEALGITADDLAFLKNNVTSLETNIGTRARLAAELGPSFDQIGGFTFEGRLDGQPNFTRRIELPQDGQPGQLIYTAAYDTRMSGKEKAQVGVLLGQNRLEFANTRQEFSVHFTLPPGGISASPASGSPVPEADLASAVGGLTPDAFSARTIVQYRDQGVLDPSRGDSNILTLDWEMTNPSAARESLSLMASGDLNGAMRVAGVSSRAEITSIERDGLAVQGGFKLDAVIAGGEGTVILEAGFDDVVGTRTVTVTPRDPGDTDPPVVVYPPAPMDDGKTLVVEPTDGLFVRDAPNGDQTGIFQNGTFLRRTGEDVIADDGSVWIPVSGTDHMDQAVEGFVSADYVRSHSSATGAMDETGRINPALEYERYDEITVVTHDNLWDLAEAHGLDVDALVELNKDHILDPDLIFAGDTVYVPGTAQGPEPVTPPWTFEDYWQNQPNVEYTSTGQTYLDGTSIPGVDDAIYAGELSGDVRSESQTNPNGPSLSPSGAGGPLTPVDPSDPPIGQNDVVPSTARDPRLSEILTTYQVPAESNIGPDGETITWEPDISEATPDWAVEAGGAIAGWIGDQTGWEAAHRAERLADRALQGRSIDVLPTEKALLDELSTIDQIEWARTTQYTQGRSTELVPQPVGNAMSSFAFGNDGHRDAVRHALWSASMTQQFGADWTEAYTTAHEMGDNPAAREAMDLYNNEVGRNIALENPGASQAEIEGLVLDALRNGELLVIDRNGDLAWSNQVAVGDHGHADESARLPANRPYADAALERD